MSRGEVDRGQSGVEKEGRRILEREDPNGHRASAKASSWSVYLLTCTDGTFYCGVTTDVQRRLAMHNGLLPGGARYTSGRRPVTLAAVAEGLTRSEALRLEIRVKKLPREKKLAALTAARAGIPEAHKA